MKQLYDIDFIITISILHSLGYKPYDCQCSYRSLFNCGGNREPEAAVKHGNNETSTNLHVNLVGFLFES
jgi:hypothetical protein